MFQLLTDFMGPSKVTLSISSGTPWWPGPSVLVQSQRRHRFLMTMIEGVWNAVGGRSFNVLDKTAVRV